MRRAILTSSLFVLIVAATASAAPVKPADHHGYRWGTQKLLCTSVKKERRAADTVTIVVSGKRYWCSRPTFGGTAAKAAAALHTAYPDSYTNLSCSGGGAVWVCAWQTVAFAGTAKVTFTAKGPVVSDRVVTGG